MMPPSFSRRATRTPMVRRVEDSVAGDEGVDRVGTDKIVLLASRLHVVGAVVDDDLHLRVVDYVEVPVLELRRPAGDLLVKFDHGYVLHARVSGNGAAGDPRAQADDENLFRVRVQQHRQVPQHLERRAYPACKWSPPAAR